VTPWVAALLSRAPSVAEVMGAVAVLVLAACGVLLAVAFGIFDSRRRRVARDVLTGRRPRAESDGLTYFARQRERQVETRETTTSTPSDRLPTGSRERAQDEIERAATRAWLDDRLAIVWGRIQDDLAAGQAAQPGDRIDGATHPQRWPLVYVHGHLCAVGPHTVERWDAACGRWFGGSTALAEAARRALGRTT